MHVGRRIRLGLGLGHSAQLTKVEATAKAIKKNATRVREVLRQRWENVEMLWREASPWPLRWPVLAPER